MKLVFVSNMLNHHLYSLCRAFQNRVDDFAFVATERIEKIGYQKASDADFLIPYYDEKYKNTAVENIRNADVVIYGGCPNDLVELRMQEDKLSFLYSERFLKKGTWRRWIPSTRHKIYNRIVKYSNRNIYILCASAFLPLDLTICGFPTERCFKWGYFPDSIEYSSADLSEQRKKEKLMVLWAGRFLTWKHPEMAVQLAQRLTSEGIDFELNMIGDGETYSKTEHMIQTFGLNATVHLLGSMSPKQVREKMLSSDIFLATSDYYEGWGAVVNEAMNSGSVVIASHAMGSVPYLMKHNENGLVYHSGNVDELYEKVRYLLDYPEEQKRLGKAAYETITGEWNAEVAAERLITLSEHLLAGEKHLDLYQTGPCSRAEIIKDNWF